MPSWKVTNRASITNRPAWTVGGLGPSVGPGAWATRAIQVNANGQGPFRFRTFCTNQLGNIGGGVRNSMFGSSSDATNGCRDQPCVKAPYCSPVGGVMGHGIKLVSQSGGKILVSQSGVFGTSGDASVYKIGTKYYIFGSPDYLANPPNPGVGGVVNGSQVFPATCSPAVLPPYPLIWVPYEFPVPDDSPFYCFFTNPTGITQDECVEICNLI